MNLDLTGKRALVCGASQGIGRAAAGEIARLGASVTVVARTEDTLRLVAGDLPRSGGQQHDFLVADFSKPDELRDGVRAKASESGPYHILVHNTGGPPGGPAIDADPDAFLKAFTAHLICGQHLAQALAPGMKKAGYGRIINVISTSVKAPIPGLGVSNTIRGAVASWAKTLASELGPFGITVNNVLPGFTDTDRLTQLFTVKAGKMGGTLEGVRDAALASIPAGRLGKPEETGAAIAFLASPAAGYINGINLPVDGGRLQSL